MNDVGHDAFTSMKIDEGWNVSDRAAYGERLDVLKWLKTKGWFNPNSIFFVLATQIAAKKGNIPLLEWPIENGCKLGNYVFPSAAEGGHVNMLEFLKENKCPFNPGGSLYFASMRGSLESIQWLLRNGCSFDDVNQQVINNVVVEKGHLHVIKFFIENSFSIDKETFVNAARNGNIENLQWFLDNNCPWDKMCYSSAAESNKLEVLEWLKEKGCPRGDSVLVVDDVSSEVKVWLIVNEFTLEDEDDNNIDDY